MLAKTLNLGQDTAHIRNSVRYIINDAKTHGDDFVTFQNCSPATASISMELLNSQRNYMEGKKLKGGVLDYLLMHEIGNEILTEEQAKILHQRDLENFKGYLKSQGKNPDNYVFVAGSHLETGRKGKDQRGYFHTEILISRFDIKDIKSPMLRNSRVEWDMLSKYMINAYPEETKIKKTWREKVIEDKEKNVKNKDANKIKSFKNPQSLEGKIQNPYSKVLCHTSYKRKWETIISDSSLNYFQRRKALLKCDIDDSIDTIRDNYNKGIIKTLDFKSFTNEMNARGYSYRQTEHSISFSHKNWDSDDKGKSKKIPKLLMNEKGYRKDDILKRIDGTMNFTQDHPLVMVWNDIEKMPNDAKLRRQAIYINKCNARRCFRVANAVSWIFGNNLGGLLLGAMVIFVLLASKPKLKDIYNELEHERSVKYKKDNKTINYEVLESYESSFETKSKATTNEMSNQKDLAKENTASFEGNPNRLERVGSTGVVEPATITDKQDVIRSLAYDSVDEIMLPLHIFVQQRNKYPKNSSDRKLINEKILLELEDSVGPKLPEFKSYIVNELGLEFKVLNVLNNYDKWINDIASPDQQEEIAKKYNRTEYYKYKAEQKESIKKNYNKVNRTDDERSAI